MVLNIILPLALPMGHLSYSYQGVARIGARVVVPLGKSKQAIGIVASTRDGLNGETLREVIELLDTEPLMSPKWVEFIEFIALYYMCTKGEVLKTFIPSHILSQNFTPSNRLFKNRHKKSIPIYMKCPEPTLQPNKSVSLLHTHNSNHITQTIASLHTQGTTLVLAPNEFEVRKLATQLSPYARIVTYHPKLSVKRRAEIFVEIATINQSQIVIGTRSSIGLPFVDLRLIAILDEHSFAYKSPRSPRYNARDMALSMASFHNAKVLMTSDSPSMESYFNATTLPTWEYINQSESDLPLKSTVLEHGVDFLSKYFKRRAQEEIAKSKQVVVFQNRRGTGSIACPSCGDIPMCSHCNCALTLHPNQSLLKCHYCGYCRPFDPLCSSCKKDQYQSRGRGTQRIEQQLTELYPDARIARLDSDNAEKYEEITREFSSQELDLIVGTQLVLGSLDFSSVGLIAVANADNMLGINDFRASEQAYRQLRSLAIKCRESGAELIIQTSSHANGLIQNAITNDTKKFYIEELVERKEALYPPFSRLIEIDMRSEDSARLFNIATQIENTLRPIFTESLSPLFQPTIARQSGQHIAKLLLRIDRRKSAATAKERIVGALAKIISDQQKKVNITFVVDPL